MAIPHDHELDGRLHRDCVACLRIKWTMQRIKDHKVSTRDLTEAYARAFKRYVRKRGKDQ